MQKRKTTKTGVATKRKTATKPRKKQALPIAHLLWIVPFISAPFGVVVYFIFFGLVMPIALAFGFQNSLGRAFGKYLKTRPTHRLRDFLKSANSQI